MAIEGDRHFPIAAPVSHGPVGVGPLVSAPTDSASSTGPALVISTGPAAASSIGPAPTLPVQHGTTVGASMSRSY